jgi:hypothetical protein
MRAIGRRTPCRRWTMRPEPNSGTNPQSFDIGLGLSRRNVAINCALDCWTTGTGRKQFNFKTGEKSWLVFTSIENFDHDRCVDLSSRPDASYGFEEFRRDVEYRGEWTPVQYYSGFTYTSPDAALAAVMQLVAWLADAIKESSSARRIPRPKLRIRATSAFGHFVSCCNSANLAAIGAIADIARFPASLESVANDPTVIALSIDASRKTYSTRPASCPTSP